MKDLSRYFCTIFSILFCVTIVYCQDDNFYNEEISEEEVDPHSFFYDRTVKREIAETDLAIPKEISPDRHSGDTFKNVRNIDENNLSERIFYKRLINLLLSNIEIQVKNDESIIGTLQIKVSPSQMETLQNFDIQKVSLRKVDAILSEIVQKPQYNYIPHFMYSMETLCNMFGNLLRMMNENIEVTLVGCLMAVSLFLMRKINLGRGFPIFILVQIILVMSFFMTWWQLIQDEQIKLMAAQMQFSEMPIACQPDKMNIWHKIVSFVTSNDDCEKYYKTMMSNPKLQVTPALALTHFISTVILHPITHVGTTISSFIDNSTERLPWAYGWIVRLLLFISVALVICMLPFCLSGASLKMGLGPLFHFGIDYGRKERKGNTLKNSQKREPIEIIRQEHQPVGRPVRKALEADKSQAVTKDSDVDNWTDVENESQNIVEDFSGGDTILITKPNEIDDETSEMCATSKTVNKKKPMQDGSGDS